MACKPEYRPVVMRGKSFAIARCHQCFLREARDNDFSGLVVVAREHVRDTGHRVIIEDHSLTRVIPEDKVGKW